MSNVTEELLVSLNKKRIWDEEPVFCYTSDIDWASEAVLKNFFDEMDSLEISPTLFVTHESEIIEQRFTEGKADRGIHPNFLPGSSQGNSFKEVIETCIKFAPETQAIRSHRLFDVTDITHMLKDQYNFKYISNLGTIMHNGIRPILHESGLVHFPIFFEDGTHLWNQLDLDPSAYSNLFLSPGIKIISFHPMNYVFNSPSIKYMRSIKDSMSRCDFNSIDADFIKKNKSFGKRGIADTVNSIIDMASEKKIKVMSLKELYNESIR